ncbi:BglG family transcription antiterminator [Streptococcus orisasini]|uniref:BglG family transcription antiterminator n=1 Tax=Streptococcus orisasini TaxID=1080071 RepID=UPI0007106DC9|nr:PTS sugar transporter subunit IIA [Streptococcus orisasini]
MNQRSKEILHFLIEKNQSSLKELSDIHGVSERTIRNDMASLNDYLQNLSFGSIAVKNKQIRMELCVSKKLICENMKKFNVYEYKFSSNERSLICLLILISSHGYVTLSQLSEKLLASRSTIVNDVKSMRKLASKHHLEVISKANKGYKIEAKEEDSRSFIYSVISQDNFTALESVIFEEGYQHQINLSLLQDIVTASRDKLNLSEKKLNSLLTYTIICSYRRYKGFALTEDFPCPTNLLEIFQKPFLEKAYPYLDKKDLAFIFNQILEGEPHQVLDGEINKETLRIQVIAMAFIEKIAKDLQIDFKDDYIFYENFSAHLLRMMRKEIVDSASLDISDLIKNNPKIKQVILNNLYIIEKNIGRKASAAEIDYIIIYVYAAIERKKRIGSNLRAAVLTEHKATEVFFIESKLLSQFSFSLDIYSVDDTIRGDYDLILTTTPVPNKDYIQISPYISDEDYLVIAHHINRIVQDKELSQLTLDKETASAIYQIITEEIDSGFKNKQDLKRRIRTKIFTHISQAEAESETALYEFLTPERIKLDVEATDWQDSIRKVGEKLIAKGDITEDYLKVVINNIKENGPYVVISQGFAFPHAPLGDYNKRTSMSLIRLKNTVYFDDEEHDNPRDIATMPVKYVCMLSITDRRKHLRAIFNLFNLLKDKDFREKMNSCHTAQEIHNLIYDKERLLELRR